LLVGSVALTFALLGKSLLTIWLKNPTATLIVYPILTILLIGTGLNAFYNVGYIHWIVCEKPNRIFQVNILSLGLSITLIPILVTRYGTIGAAFGWLTINLIGFVLSLGWLNKNRI
jgi:O-antigen/teichoic acid export membrane protein